MVLTEIYVSLQKILNLKQNRYEEDFISHDRPHNDGQ